MFTQFKRLVFNTWLLTTLISLLTVTVALAAPGDLDFMVATNIVSTTTRWDRVYGIAIQPNGKIVAAGYSQVHATGIYDFALARYNTNGSLDTTFSGDGMLLTNFGGNDVAWDVAVQPNGKIVAAGYKCNSDFSSCDVALARYNPGGALDTTFSGDGKVVTNFGGGNNGSIGGLAIQSDGKIVVAGYMYTGTDSNFAIYRYNPNGALDTTFSGDGVAVGNFGINQQDIAYDLALQNDGKIVVAGVTGNANGNNFAVARLNPNGSADLTFSGDGRQTTNFGADDYAYGLALQPNGKIVVVGKKQTVTGSSFAVARYNTNGSLDTTFNSTGKKVFSFMTGEDSYAYDVIAPSNGQIVILGGTNFGGDWNFALVRLKAGGAFDSSFGAGGKISIDYFAWVDEGYALALQPSDGKYLVGGSVYTADDFEFGLARVLP